MKSILSLVGLCWATQLWAAPVDFTRDVRPILAQHCFKCHGPDDNVRKGGLRFDQRPSALGKGKSGLVSIVPGKPEASEFIKRLNAHDADELMPPPAAKKPLSDAQKTILTQWVREGAEYKEHWSFVRPVAVPLPKVKQGTWPKNGIDHFTLAKLEAIGLQPTRPTDQYTLIRRVYLDLIGLPPTPEQADAFINDKDPKAYEKVVDQLLQSPHYGERWARRWLDLARYADTNGYEKDRPRTMWPYRDWVIQALNNDLPYDRFTIEQLAGDLLPKATEAQRLATGFHRNTMLNEEGGADPLEFRWHAVNDRTATTGTVWLGLTLNCCQCHNHKYDPLSHQEYYQLFAFLNNCDEPTIDVAQADLVAKRTTIEQQAQAREAQLATMFPADPKLSKGTVPTADQRAAYLQTRFTAWLEQERAKAIAWTVLTPKSAKANIPTLTVEEQGNVFVSGDKSKRDVYDLTFHTYLQEVRAIRIEVLPDDRLPNRGPGRTSYEGPFGEFFFSEMTLTQNGQAVKWGTASHSFAEGKHQAANVVDGNPLTGWAINGGQGKAHAAVFNLATPIKGGDFTLQMLFEKYYAAGLGKFRIAVTDHAQPAEARGLPAAIEELLRTPDAKLTVAEREQLRQHFLRTSPELKAERDAIQALRNTAPKLPTALVMVERPAHNPRTTYLHKRGEFTQPTTTVEPGVPAVLPPLPKGPNRNRLAFAEWLMAPEHPLTARVAVNRAWAAFFGRGIVRTTEDFGLQGEPPTHPELLDWLALEFIRLKWSTKQLHKLIVMSATYQQASTVTPTLLERDPKNEWLSRGPRFRLDGELLRDQALQASGLLAPKVGGPSVFPPQPPGVTTEGAYGALAWNVSTGADRYRRGLYTFAKRTAPYAMFLTFDGPSGEACVARRELSNTPLQALMVLNDTVFVEAAQTLGKKLSATVGTPEDKVRELWRRWLIRPPEADELAVLVQFYKQQRQRYTANPAEAKALVGTADEAAWTATARAILNLDETLTRE